MAMTKSEISRRLADKVGISKKQSDAYLEALAQLAYEEAKNTFTVPGLGKLVLVEKQAREATMPFGPRKGERYMIPAKKAVKFRLSKAAKDAIVGPAAVKKDDLALIEGIGPKIAHALESAGIHTFKQLSETPVERIHHVLADAKLAADPGTWPQQAKLAAEGRMDELKNLQDELQGGRRV